jgi:hypothetical protein
VEIEILKIYLEVYMISSVNAIAKVLQVAIRGADLVVDIDDLMRSRAYEDLKKISIATRTTLLFFSIADLAMVLSGQSRTALYRGVKSIEPVAHIFNLPVNAMEAIEVFTDPHASTIDKIKAAEKKILGSFISVTRSMCESELTWQRHYRDLPPEEQKKLQFPIYESDGDDGYNLVGYEKFDKEKCLQTIANLESCIPKMNVAEATTQANFVGRVLGVSTAAFNLLVARVAAHRPPPAPPQGGAVVAARAQGPRLPIVRPVSDDAFDDAVTESLAPSSAVQPQLMQQIQPSSDEWLNLSYWKVIPVELHEDEVFKRFICAITNLPIRHIVQDPTLEASQNATERPQPVYYEKSAIEYWLRTRAISPMTRKPLSVSMLRPCVSIQVIINNRLKTYSDRLKQSLQQMDSILVDHDQINNAIQRDNS